MEWQRVFRVVHSRRTWCSWKTTLWYFSDCGKGVFMALRWATFPLKRIPVSEGALIRMWCRLLEHDGESHGNPGIPNRGWRSAREPMSSGNAKCTWSTSPGRSKRGKSNPGDDDGRRFPWWPSVLADPSSHRAGGQHAFVHCRGPRWRLPSQRRTPIATADAVLGTDNVRRGTTRLHSSLLTAAGPSWLGIWYYGTSSSFWVISAFHSMAAADRAPWCIHDWRCWSALFSCRAYFFAIFPARGWRAGVVRIWFLGRNRIRIHADPSYLNTDNSLSWDPDQDICLRTRNFE